MCLSAKKIKEVSVDKIPVCTMSVGEITVIARKFIFARALFFQYNSVYFHKNFNIALKLTEKINRKTVVFHVAF